MLKICDNKKCSKWHFAIDRSITFCAECGQALIDQATCPKCEYGIYPSDNFCENCGRPLK